VNQVRLFVRYFSLFVATVFAMADEPQQSLSDFLDPQRSAEQRTKALAALVRDEEGVRILTNAAGTRDHFVTTAMSVMFESATPATRALVMHAVVQSRDQESYSVLRPKALRDDDSQVRASTFGAAAVFADQTQEVIDAVVKEIKAAQAGSALAAASQFGARFELPEAIDPLVELLKNGSLGSRELAAQTLAAYSKLPENTRDVLSSAVEVARKDAARLDAVYQFLPSAKNPSGTSAAENLQRHLERALSNVGGSPRSVAVPPATPPPMAPNDKSATTPIQPKPDAKPISSDNQDNPAKEITIESSHTNRRLWPLLGIVALLGLVFLSWKLLHKPKSS